jgi:hypothetical protein
MLYVRADPLYEQTENEKRRPAQRPSGFNNRAFPLNYITTK